MSRSVSALRDHELVELLADQPELLALADAIAATAPTRSRRRFPTRLLAGSITIAAAAVVALVAPWSESRGGVLQQALAAVSTDSVLHAVLVSQVPETTVVDLRSFRETPTTLRVETWFDARKGLKRILVTRGGESSDVVATPQGVWSNAGRVPTCAWIAAHPVLATRLRVSCNASGRNGTRPRDVPESRPTADPALTAFIPGYRAALHSLKARNLGKGSVGGHAVYWISFVVSGSRPATTERVAVDRHSFRPLLHETVVEGQVVSRSRVVAIGSVAFSPSLFKRPSLDRRVSPSSGEVARTRHVSRVAAERAFGGAARALGGTFSSLPLIDARIDQLTTGYGPLAGKPVTRATGVEFVYGDSGGLFNGNAFLRLSEALSPQMAYGMRRAGVPVAPKSLLLTRVESVAVTSSGGAPSRVLWFGQMRAGRLYVALQSGSRQLILRAAQALEKDR